MVGTVNVKKNSTLNVNNFGQLVDQSDGQFFSRHFRVLGVNIPKGKNPGKCHDLQRKCKI